MKDQVEEVKQKTDIVGIIGEKIQLKKAGRNYKALCPFHNEKTPSFMVSPELQIFKCFGCGETGDVFSFLEKYEGMEFGEALRYLADRVGVKLAPLRFEDRGEKERLIEINSYASKFYHYVLLHHPAGKIALDYLTKERELKPATIEEFQLGFSPDAPGAIERLLVSKKKFAPSEVEKAGIIYRAGSRAVDRFRGRVIFPLFDHRGNVVGLAGRILPSEKNKDLAKYINSPDTPVYHKGSLLYGLNLSRSLIKKKNTAIVVEGELDMISSWQAGIKNTVALKGTALTEDQLRLLSRFSERAILALDSDIAGDVAARRGITIAQNLGMEIKVALMGKYKDPDEAARKDLEGYKQALIKSIGVWDFMVESVFTRFDAKSGSGKAKISKEIIPILASIPDKIVQAHYIEVVADKLKVPDTAVIEQIESFNQKEKVPEVAIAAKEEKEKDRRTLLEERFLTLAFQSDPTIFLTKNIRELFATPLANRLLETYEDFSRKKKKFDVARFADTLPEELIGGYTEMVLQDTEGLVENKEALESELKLVIKELKKLDIREKLQAIEGKMKDFEAKEDKAGLKKAQEEFGKISNLLSELEEENASDIILQE
ncbi:DNA primase [Patescibacteria group bacterium]|nr:DNA primase [Patescibacteria group bacterium]